MLGRGGWVDLLNPEVEIGLIMRKWKGCVLTESKIDFRIAKNNKQFLFVFFLRF